MKALIRSEYVEKWVAFGDSLTNGYGLLEEETWRSILQNKLGVRVINEGVNGRTLQEALGDMEKVLAYDPSKVLINFGTNDVFQEQDHEGSVDFERFSKNVETMIHFFQKHDIDIIWMSTHPIIEGDMKNRSYFYGRHDPEKYLHCKPNVLMEKACEITKHICNRLNVLHLDLFHDERMQESEKVLRTLQNSGEDDGVHYGPKGAQYVAKRLEEILEEAKK